jgi:HPt (histidine-containing phosphotransfer) domain-containing protein
LLKWIPPGRLAGRSLAALPAPDLPHAEVAAALPAIDGVDWKRAAVGTDDWHARLHKRIQSFLREYAGAAQQAHEALAAGEPARLQGLAHNLKASASYIGAWRVSGLADALEGALRTGERPERTLTLATELAEALEGLLAGLARAEAPAAPAPVQLDAGDLIRRLDAYLRSDDARAEDTVQSLQLLLSGAAQDDPAAAQVAALVAEIVQAVEDIEYDAALAPLNRLAQALDVTLEERA